MPRPPVRKRYPEYDRAYYEAKRERLLAYGKEYYRKNKEKRAIQTKLWRERRRGLGIKSNTVWRRNPLLAKICKAKGVGIAEAQRLIIELYERRPELRDKDAEYLAQLGYPPEPSARHFPVPVGFSHVTGKTAGCKRRRSASVPPPRATPS
jgi:hypothetical protein